MVQRVEYEDWMKNNEPRQNTKPIRSVQYQMIGTSTFELKSCMMICEKSFHLDNSILLEVIASFVIFGKSMHGRHIDTGRAAIISRFNVHITHIVE